MALCVQSTLQIRATASQGGRQRLSDFGSAQGRKQRDSIYG